jgi:hypothetical protein
MGKPDMLGICQMKAKIVLDYDASFRIIESAIRTQAQLVLSFAEYPEHTLNGFLISGDQSALLMELTGRPTLNLNDLVNMSCQVRLYSDQRYQFASEVTGAPKWGETRSVSLARPMALSVMDRRRFLRAELAPSAKVSVEWTDGDGAHHQSATLLNVSADGMALKMDNDGASQLHPETRLVTTFSMPGHNRPFQMQGTLANKTPGTDDYSIVGIQFSRTPNQTPQLDTLRQLLTRQPGPDVEVPA